MRLKWVALSELVTVGINEDCYDKIVVKILSICSASEGSYYVLTFAPKYRGLDEEEWRKGGDFISLAKAQEYFEKCIWRWMLFCDPPIASTAVYSGVSSLDTEHAKDLHKHRMGLALEELVSLCSGLLKRVDGVTINTKWWKK